MGSFISSGRLMFLVTGGCGSSEMWNYETTETFDPSVGSWVLTEAKLPRPVYEPRAATINGRVLIFGGCDTDLNTFDDILEYVPEEDTIIPVGNMIETRYNHAVSVVPAEDYLQWC